MCVRITGKLKIVEAEKTGELDFILGKMHVRRGETSEKLELANLANAENTIQAKAEITRMAFFLQSQGFTSAAGAFFSNYGHPKVVLFTKPGFHFRRRRFFSELWTPKSSFFDKARVSLSSSRYCARGQMAARLAQIARI